LPFYKQKVKIKKKWKSTGNPNFRLHMRAPVTSGDVTFGQACARDHFR
jgi:hypothetical protein